VAFSVFLYGALSNGLRERVDETLRSEAGTAAGMYEDELSETNGDRPASAAEAVAGARFTGTVVAVVAEGRVLAASTRAPLGDLAAVAARAAGAGADAVTAFPQYGKHGARAAARRAGQPGRQVLVLALAPLDSIASELSAVRRALFVALPLMLGLAGLAGSCSPRAGSRHSPGWPASPTRSAPAACTSASKSAAPPKSCRFSRPPSTPCWRASISPLKPCAASSPTPPTSCALPSP